MPRNRILALAVLLSPIAAANAQQSDVLIADFEGEDYGEWTATGEAFGPGPARGTLPGQMEVTGFEGSGLVNTFHRGDGTTGTLTSPSFTIERRYLCFLLGGGMHPGETCMNLLVDGEVVRTATGPNDRPGGTERLDWYSWDVSDLSGRAAVLEIIDRHTGGWGHVNVDQILQSDRVRAWIETTRDLVIEGDLLAFCFGPDQSGRSRVTLRVDGGVVRDSPAPGREDASWITWDVARLRGQTGQLVVLERPEPDGRLAVADSVAFTDEVRGALIVVDQLYRETWRPQFHFTPRTNWTNDPNGLVYYEGEYHLFFQHNPFATSWGNMTWGHAVSRDLVHWSQIEHAIHPDEMGTIFSGSAAVDWNDTAGFQSGEEKTLVAFYTSAGGTSPESQGQPFTQSIAHSNDRGRTWVKYPGNPVLGHVAGSNRDPKVIWHEPTGRWIMALFLDGNDFALFGSADLKEWERLCDVAMPGSGECPDFFELPVDGDPEHSLWLFWAGNGNYRLGRFDGTTFTSETEPLRSRWGANCYAAQTWSDVPDGRRLQIAWMNGGRYPGMPFNQQMTFPRELTLRTTEEGVRLFLEPVGEIETIRGLQQMSIVNTDLEPGENPLAGQQGELWEIDVFLDPGEADAIGLAVRGEEIRYDVQAGTLRCLAQEAPLALENGQLRLHVVVDRTSIEVFANDGRVSMCSCFLPDLYDRSLALFAEGGSARIVGLVMWELESIWGDE